jgi:hypothetical protein
VKTADPLAELRDIHLPDPVSWWPPAPGWWLLLLLVIAMAGLSVWLWRRRAARRNQPVSYSRRQMLDAARIELARIEAAIGQADDVRDIAARLSGLLRRVALQSPADKAGQGVAGLTGDAWLKWLDGQWDEDRFCNGAGRGLAEAPYRPDAEIHISELAETCRDWLKAQQ